MASILSQDELDALIKSQVRGSRHRESTTSAIEKEDPIAPTVLSSPNVAHSHTRSLSFASMFGKLVDILLYLRTLIEDEPGIMSMRRVSYFIALLAVLYMLLFQPERITESVVGALREILIVVALVYGAPRMAESITEAVNAIRELRK